MVKNIEEYLDTLKEEKQRDRIIQLINWIGETYGNLKLEVKWNQPMFNDHETYIIGI